MPVFHPVFCFSYKFVPFLLFPLFERVKEPKKENRTGTKKKNEKKAKQKR